MRYFTSFAFVFASFFAGIASADCNASRLEAKLSTDELSALQEEVAATPFGDSILWHAEKGEAELTILGTLHLPDPRLDTIMERVNPYLLSAELLLVEATLSDQDAFQTYLMANPDLYLLPEGKTLIDMLDPAVWELVSDAAKERGMPPMLISRMQPWFLGLNLSMPPCAMGQIMRGETGLDNQIMSAAEGYIPIKSLESWETLLDILRAGTLEEQIDGLEATMTTSDLQDAMIGSMLDAYIDGSPAYAWLVTHRIKYFLPEDVAQTYNETIVEVENLLLNQRNQDWIPVIEGAAESYSNIFVAFGAAHLIGAEGVPALLEANGWTITKIED